MLGKFVVCALYLLVMQEIHAGGYANRIAELRRQEAAENKKPVTSMSPAERRAWISRDTNIARTVISEFERDGDLASCNEKDLITLAELYEKCFAFSKALDAASAAADRYPESTEAKEIKFRSLLNLKRIREADEFVDQLEKGLRKEEEPIAYAHSFLAMRYRAAGDWANVARHCDRSLIQGLGKAHTDPTRLRQCVVDVGVLSRSVATSERATECRDILAKYSRRLHEELEVLTSASDLGRTEAVENALFEVCFEISAQSAHAATSDVAAWWLERQHDRWQSRGSSAYVMLAVSTIGRRAAALGKGSERLKTACSQLRELAVQKHDDRHRTAGRIAHDLETLVRRLN